MEIGEDRLACPHSRPFAADWLLHLHYHVRLAPDAGAIACNPRSGARVELVPKAAALACTMLDQHVVAGGNESFRAGRNERDAILVCLDLLGNADLHWMVVSRRWVVKQIAGRRRDPDSPPSVAPAQRNHGKRRGHSR